MRAGVGQSFAVAKRSQLQTPPSTRNRMKKLPNEPIWKIRAPNPKNRRASEAIQPQIIMTILPNEPIASWIADFRISRFQMVPAQRSRLPLQRNEPNPKPDTHNSELKPNFPNEPNPYGSQIYPRFETGNGLAVTDHCNETKPSDLRSLCFLLFNFRILRNEANPPWITKPRISDRRLAGDGTTNGQQFT